jgi:hypothetical protein
MAKRRTKKQKVGARHSYQYSLSEEKLADGIGDVKTSRKTPTPSRTSLYAYDPQLIVKDLQKTVVVSAVILGIELAIFWLWR